MHGNHVRTSLCERTISIDFERFRDIPLVIGVAWETWRARALHACLVGGLMSALATNQGMAELLLDDGRITVGCWKDWVCPCATVMIAIAASTYNSTLSVNDAPYPPVMSKINP